MGSSIWNSLAEAICRASGIPFVLRGRHGVGGGCINSTHVLEDGARRWFVKLNDATRLDMFAAEAAGLSELAASHTVRVPRPLCHGVAAGQAFLVLEWLDLSGSGAQELLGRQLAAMHGVTREEYGWWRDNTIGSTPQPNEQSMDWMEFMCERRLGHQLDLAVQAGNRRLHRRGEELLDRMPDLFTDYTPAASLLHGDLWSGNYAVTAAGEPVLFDPAVYYGDREADLAMTELFGGFGPRFYAAYNEAWPLDPGYKVRKTLYNLYHILNHYHMFGGGYGQQAERMIDQLLSELR
ncbi:fructosamine kinase family protein [Sulfurivermis fontis]|uniref:fructosamine kinase family protein n=1 Tax=Sulfurivermis fontis TaxID=1972068 RepID=UPI000FDB6683|nr:fructosamine kinase family protein [Sulfurivermis fontis]